MAYADVAWTECLPHCAIVPFLCQPIVGNLMVYSMVVHGALDPIRPNITAMNNNNTA